MAWNLVVIARHCRVSPNLLKSHIHESCSSNIEDPCQLQIKIIKMESYQLYNSDERQFLHSRAAKERRGGSAIHPGRMFGFPSFPPKVKTSSTSRPSASGEFLHVFKTMRLLVKIFSTRWAKGLFLLAWHGM